MEHKEFRAEKNKVLKIVVPCIILAIVLVLWFLKNDGTDSVLSEATGNPDFMLTANEDFDLEKLKEYNLPIILDFGTSWCPPCQEMAPTMIKLNSELAEKAIIKYVDIDLYPDIAKDYPITVIPTQFLFTDEGAPFVGHEGLDITLLMYENFGTSKHALTAHEGYLSEVDLLLLLTEMGMVND